MKYILLSFLLLIPFMLFAEIMFIQKTDGTTVEVPVASITSVSFNNNVVTTIIIHTMEEDVEFELDEITSITFAEDPVPEGMVFVQGGTFLMGDHYNEGYSDELPTHNVTVSSFSISQYEVTQGEYQTIMGNNPAYDYGVGNNYPVYYVSWYDAVAYCNARSAAEGLIPCYSDDGDDITCDWNANGYRLPTEAEWEYAARGGQSSTGDWHYSGSDYIGDVAVYNDTIGSSPVGTKNPNDLNIYDMSGNVWEWCWDWYGNYSSTDQTNPQGAASGSFRVLRGGCWSYYPGNGRVAGRSHTSPSGSYTLLGFRVLRSGE